MALTCAPLLNARELANIHWSVAHVGAQQPDLLSGLQRHLLRQLDSCNAQDLANTAWALATIGQRQPPALLQALGDAAAALPQRSLVNPQHVANLAWAFGKMRVRHDGLMAVLGAAAQQLAGRFSSQQLANLLWATATLKQQDSQLYRALMRVSHALGP